MTGDRHGGPRREMTPWDVASMVLEGITFLAQVVLAVLFYNRAGLTGLLVLGWALVVVAMLLGWRARIDFQAKGQAPEGGSWLNTTEVVDSGIYAVVRHPMYLSFMLLSLALVCLAQHWLSAILGAVLILLLYVDMIREEGSSTKKLGHAYQDYMRRVPRMNFVSGLLRMVRRG